MGIFGEAGPKLLQITAGFDPCRINEIEMNKNRFVAGGLRALGARNAHRSTRAFYCLTNPTAGIPVTETGMAQSFLGQPRFFMVAAEVI